MSTYPNPSIEARVSALERRQIITDARFEDLSQDTTVHINQLSAGIRILSDTVEGDFKQLAEYQIRIERQVENRFNLIEEQLDQIKKVLAQIIARLPEKP